MASSDISVEVGGAAFFETRSREFLLSNADDDEVLLLLILMCVLFCLDGAPLFLVEDVFAAYDGAPELRAVDVVVLSFFPRTFASGRFTPAPFLAIDVGCDCCCLYGLVTPFAFATAEVDLADATACANDLLAKLWLERRASAARCERCCFCGGAMIS